MVKKREIVIASDGLIARDNGEWGKHKLAFLEHFGPSALDATKTKLTRAYIDLFAGPGINVIRNMDAQEFPGSPLRALALKGPQTGKTFTDLYFINLDNQHHQALSRRIDITIEVNQTVVPRNAVRNIHGDSHQIIRSILEELHPESYLFVFADPDSPKQLPWATLECLRRHRNHSSIDLYVLFPYGMAIQRLISYDPKQWGVMANALNEFYGDESWRECLPYRDSDALRGDFRDCMITQYERRLKTLWTHVEPVCDVRGSQGSLYKMLFATDHPAGRNIAAWAKRYIERERTHQTSFL